MPSWHTRPCGTLSPQELERRIAEGECLAADPETNAATEETAARALAARFDDEQATGRPARRQYFATEAGHLLDQAQVRLTTACEHLQAASTAAGHAEERTRHLATLAETAGKGRLVLRLAGTSRKEHRELARRLSAERAEHQAAEAAARRNTRRPLKEVWELVTQSRFAEHLGAAGQPVPDQVDNAAEQLAQMRAAAVRHGHSIDKRDHDDLTLTTRRAGELQA